MSIAGRRRSHLAVMHSLELAVASADASDSGGIGLSYQIRRQDGRPEGDSMRLTRLFFLPSGLSVDRHVRQGFMEGGRVKQSTCGRVEEVPVPRRMNSTTSLSLMLWARASMEPMSTSWM